MALKARQTEPPPIASYDADFHRWTEEQGRALREHRVADIDWANIAEEIETLGRSERSEIRSRLLIILHHLLKWHFQPHGRGASWEATLREQRDELRGALDDSPSLRSYPPTTLQRQYRLARSRAAAETGLPIDAFPAECPYTVEQILDEDFHPDAPAE
jgi:hypothetical protein